MIANNTSAEPSPNANVREATGCKAFAILALINGVAHRFALYSMMRAPTCAGPMKEAAAIATAGVTPNVEKRPGRLVAIPMLTIPAAVKTNARMVILRSGISLGAAASSRGLTEFALEIRWRMAQCPCIEWKAEHDV